MRKDRAFAPSGSTSGTHNWPEALARLAAACCVVFALDAAVFRTGWYQHVLEPQSFAGTFARAVRNERQRPVDGRKEILVAGDSRSLAIRPRIAEELTGRREFAFATVAVPGSSPRGWYYLLRDVDPEARRYTAILFGVEDYDDEDSAEEPAERLLDLQMAVGSLRLTDLFDFPFTFRGAQNERQAFLGCLLKGFAYKKDLQGFLAHPKHRWNDAAIYRERSVREDWNATGPISNLAGLKVDWAARKLTFPPGVDPLTRELLQRQVDHPSYPQTGLNAQFRRQWLTRIADRYRNSPTVLLFLRLPRSPIPRPEALAPNTQRGVLRELAQRRNVMLADERVFESLESPELFHDQFHLNAEGWTRATRIAVEQLRLALARAAGRF